MKIDEFVRLSKQIETDIRDIEEKYGLQIEHFDKTLLLGNISAALESYKIAENYKKELDYYKQIQDRFSFLVNLHRLDSLNKRN